MVENNICNLSKVLNDKLHPCFVTIGKFGRFKNYFATVTSVIELEAYSVGTNKGSDLFEQCKQQKQLKLIEMNEAWPDTSDEGYVCNIQSGTNLEVLVSLV